MTKPLLALTQDYDVNLSGNAAKCIEAFAPNGGNVICTCKRCGHRWSPNIESGGGVHRGWWRCPNGCWRMLLESVEG